MADHVMPFKLGGKTDLGNLVTACSDCNLRKGSRLLPAGTGPHPIRTTFRSDHQQILAEELLKVVEPRRLGVDMGRTS